LSKVLKSSLLASLSWLKHGFGTRHALVSQEGMASLTQVHSAIVLPAQAEGCAGEGDALIANTPGVIASVRTADCLPILLADTRTLSVAAIHAGWRGSASRIAEATLERMRAAFGTRPEDVSAAVGPGIGGCCYEVGDEVRVRFGLEGRGLLDLADVNRRQLIEAGVDPARIELLPLCTFCNPELFHSWRRDREKSSRMISYIGVR
jgi:YfiH family protein